MPSAVTLVDLDDTLFQTLRKCPPGLDHGCLTPYAYGADGLAISYATPTQLALISWLEATTVVVVVTARSSPALFRSRVNFQHAIAAHGGMIIDNTVSETPSFNPEWEAIMRDRLGDDETVLLSLKNEVERDAAALNTAVRARIIHERGLPLYLVVKDGREPADDARLHAACAGVTGRVPASWTVHINGNNVAYLPPGLGKEHAVRWLLPALRAQYPDLPVIGIGDSFSDGPFMKLCDFAMTPTQSQLAGRLFQAPERPVSRPPQSPVTEASLSAERA